MEPTDIRPAADGKGTLITFEINTSDAKKLLELFRAGQLASLGITDMRISSGHTRCEKNWSRAERDKRSDSSGRTKQHD